MEAGGRPGRWEAWTAEQLEAIAASGRWRAPRSLDGKGPVLRAAGDREVVSFASNDYLGLSAHPSVAAAAHEALDRWGTGSGAARLIVGARPIHDELEAELAAWKRTESAVLFPTGFAANLGVLSTFGGPGVTVISDELNHASIIDGCRLARARVEVARHRDVEHVAKLLETCDTPAIVVTDLVFSMDGDVAAAVELAEMCAHHDALLVLDEAHLVLDEAPSLPDLPAANLVRVGTLSKALGSLGGFVASTQAVGQLLTNRARSYIFTTASTPADAAAALTALRIVRGAEGNVLRQQLRRNIDRLAPGHPSPILPVVIGTESDAVAVAGALLNEGLVVPAIRPPTVAPGTSRLRVALSAAHTLEQVDQLAGVLDRVWPDWRAR